jgi:hypothetical protein
MGMYKSGKNYFNKVTIETTKNERMRHYDTRKSDDATKWGFDTKRKFITFFITVINYSDAMHHDDVGDVVGISARNLHRMHVLVTKNNYDVNYYDRYEARKL